MKIIQEIKIRGSYIRSKAIETEKVCRNNLKIIPRGLNGLIFDCPIS